MANFISCFISFGCKIGIFSWISTLNNQKRTENAFRIIRQIIIIFQIYGFILRNQILYWEQRVNISVRSFFQKYVNIKKILTGIRCSVPVILIILGEKLFIGVPIRSLLLFFLNHCPLLINPQRVCSLLI